MKKIMLLFLTITFLSSINAQKGQLIPIIDNSIWVMPYEVTNAEYLKFLASIEDKEQYQSMLPDSLVWLKEESYSESHVESYFRHPAYGDYPVVGINREQAIAYCQWLESKFNAAIPQNPKDNRLRIKLRLPTEKEWEIAARASHGKSALYPWEGNFLQAIKCDELPKAYKKVVGKYLACFKIMGFEQNRQTAPVESYFPNAWGCYHMAGNIAELLLDQDMVKGGSWNSYGYHLQIKQKQPFNGPSATVGFRVFAEVVAWKDSISDIRLSAKTIEKMLVNYGQPKLLAATTELNNQLYLCFIRELEGQDAALAAQYRPNSVLWEKEWESTAWQNYHIQKEFADYPVVNISHEAATAFCAWLTQKYHSFEKRKYKKVRFRLPSIKEWEKTVPQSSDPHIGIAPSYKYTQNTKGCYLLNYHPLDDQYRIGEGYERSAFQYPENDYKISRDLDYVEFTTFSHAYHPNRFGLYNVLGNVAEMVDQKGISKGGSWNSFRPALAADAQEAYSGPNPMTGFRYFMEVVEP